MAAQACLAPPDGGAPPDTPIAVASDGSFFGAEGGEDLASFEGSPIQDIGGGRTGQILTFASCDIARNLLFVDCTTGSAIVVVGTMPNPRTGEGAAVVASTRSLQPPYGPLDLQPSTTVAEVLDLARAQGWTVGTDVPAFAQARGPQNAFDPFLGCDLFYPGSVGAGR